MNTTCWNCGIKYNSGKFRNTCPDCQAGEFDDPKYDFKPGIRCEPFNIQLTEPWINHSITTFQIQSDGTYTLGIDPYRMNEGNTTTSSISIHQNQIDSPITINMDAIPNTSYNIIEIERIMSQYGFSVLSSEPYTRIVELPNNNNNITDPYESV